MKKAAILLLVLLIAFTLVGCNVAPNVPGVTTTPKITASPYPTTTMSPYVTTPGSVPGYDTNDTYRYGYNGYDYYTASPNALNDNPTLDSATDKALLPGG